MDINCRITQAERLRDMDEELGIQPDSTNQIIEEKLEYILDPDSEGFDAQETCVEDEEVLRCLKNIQGLGLQLEKKYGKEYVPTNIEDIPDLQISRTVNAVLDLCRASEAYLKKVIEVQL